MQRLKSAMRTNGALELYRADHRQKIVLTPTVLAEIPKQFDLERRAP
jgi:hypothetical protein